MTANVTTRLWMLLAILFAGFGAVFLLPKSPTPFTPGVVMTLPDFIGDWYGQDAAVSQREMDVLGKETRFARKLYTNARGDSVYVSIVLAGEDMSTSIHRPERCLPAQGFTISDTSAIKVELPPRSLSITRLHNMRPLFDNNGKPITTRDGNQVKEFSLVYYWFVGSTETTADHTTRYFIDARDRLLKGSNQPWAYVTVMGRISSHLEKYGRNEVATDAMLQDFVKLLSPVIQKPTVVTR